MMAENSRPTEQAHLFTVRIWLTPGTDRTRWRGKVRHVSSGEQHYFGEWRELILWLRDMLSFDD